jgi:hypothetical protein
MNVNKCNVPYCKEEADLIFYGKGVCNKHWHQSCQGKIELKEVFNIKE